MDDRDAVAQWREASGPRKQLLLSTFVRQKEGLIRKLTRKAANAEKSSESFDDLLQAGRMGFLRALDGWDPAKGALATYSAFWIRKHVQLATHDAMPIALPRIRLTNEERQRAIVALRKDPDVDPEALGITRSALDQVRHSIGLRYVSYDHVTDERADATGFSGRRNLTLRGLERRLNDSVEHDDPEWRIDAAREGLGEMKRVLRMVRRKPTATAEMLGVSRDVHEAALECIALDEPTTPRARRIVMVESLNGVSAPAAHVPAAARKSARNTKSTPKAKEPSYEEALRAVVAAKLGRLSIVDLEKIAAQVLTT